MKKIFAASLFAGIAAIAFSLPAAAGPIRTTFTGTVTSFFSLTGAIADTPVGTPAFFDVTFDNGSLVPVAPPPNFNLAPVSGTLRLGALEWLLDAGRISSYSYLFAGSVVQYYQLQMTGTGPMVDGTASLFGLFLTLAPDLTPTGTDPFSVGFGYPSGGGATFFRYANLTGDYSVVSAVPEPSTALLILPALALLWRRRAVNSPRDSFAIR